MLLLIGNNQPIRAQEKKCFAIKYLDFFELSDTEEVRWHDRDLDTMLKTTFFDKSVAPKSAKTNFLIPLLVLQLKEFHPACNSNTDTIRYNKLLAIYAKIRDIEMAFLKRKNRKEQLEFIRNDFYSQVLDNSSLPYMVFTTDDGPLYGKTEISIPASEVKQTIYTDFGTLSSLIIENTPYLIAKNKNSKTLWIRQLTNEGGRPLKNLILPENSATKSSRAYVFNLFAENEALTLYLELDGRFMYYFHSW